MSGPELACRGYSEPIEATISINNEACTVTSVKYTIQRRDEGHCELYLIVFKKKNIVYSPTSTTINNVTLIYDIPLLSFPKGFMLSKTGYCECDPVLLNTLVLVTRNITVLCPGYSWISSHTVNNLHAYNVSLSCPFDYCFPQPTYINLFIPDSSCKFSRHGVLCGQCLSTVFGSSQCKHCSNTYLLVTVPVAIAGFIFVHT